jgi:hypothetical protein
MMMKTRALLIMVLLIAVLMLAATNAVAAREGERGGLTSLSTLQGKDILGPEGRGKRLGIVHDVLIGPSGEFTFLVLSRGSAFGIVGPFYLIPWRMAAPQIRRDAVVIAFDANIMEKAPAIRMEVWPPDTLAPESIEQVRAYYRQAQGKPFQRSSD